MSLKPKIEALIYAAEEPISLDQLAALLKQELLALKPAPEAPQTETPQAEAEQPEAPQAEAPQPEAAQGELLPAPSDAVAEPAQDQKRAKKSERAELREMLRPVLEELIADCAREDRGIEIRQVAGGYRMSTKPEHHDVIRAFAKSLKPPIRLSLPALETLAVIAYKQPVTVPEISEIRGVDAGGVIGTLLERKLITTAGRKAVVGRPIQYKTSKDFLLRFGLNDINDLPSLEEFEKLAAGELQEDLAPRDAAVADATGVPDDNGGIEQMAEDQTATPQNVTEPTVSSDPRHDQTDEQVVDEIAAESTGG